MESEHAPNDPSLLCCHPNAPIEPDQFDLLFQTTAAHPKHLVGHTISINFPVNPHGEFLAVDEIPRDGSSSFFATDSFKTAKRNGTILAIMLDDTPSPNYCALMHFAGTPVSCQYLIAGYILHKLGYSTETKLCNVVPQTQTQRCHFHAIQWKSHGNAPATSPLVQIFNRLQTSGIFQDIEALPLGVFEARYNELWRVCWHHSCKVTWIFNGATQMESTNVSTGGHTGGVAVNNAFMGTQEVISAFRNELVPEILLQMRQRLQECNGINRTTHTNSRTESRGWRQGITKAPSERTEARGWRQQLSVILKAGGQLQAYYCHWWLIFTDSSGRVRCMASPRHHQRAEELNVFCPSLVHCHDILALSLHVLPLMPSCCSLSFSLSLPFPPSSPFSAPSIHVGLQLDSLGAYLNQRGLGLQNTFMTQARDVHKAIQTATRALEDSPPAWRHQHDDALGRMYYFQTASNMRCWVLPQASSSTATVQPRIDPGVARVASLAMVHSPP